MACAEADTLVRSGKPIGSALFTDLVKMGKDYSQGMLPPEIEKVRNMGDKAVMWVFSGGVARAPFHIGVAAAFFEAGIPCDLGVGTSAGSIAMEAVSRCYNLQALLHAKRLGETASWDQLRERVPLLERAVYSFDRLSTYIDTADAELDTYSEGQKPTPTIVTACEMINHKPTLRLFFSPPEGETRGRIVQASASMRGLVKPIKMGGRTYIDGSCSPKEGFEPVGAVRAINKDAIVISVKIQQRGKRHISSSAPDFRVVPDWRLTRNPYTEFEFEPNDVFNGYFTGHEYVKDILALMVQRGIPQRFKKGFGEPNVLAHYFPQRHII